MEGQALLNDIVRALGKAKSDGPNRWKVLCPAHPDKNPSLSVTLGDNGMPVFYCHACDASGEIIIPILRDRGLWPETKKTRAVKPLSIFPAPMDCPENVILDHAGNQPAGLWSYFNWSGNLCFMTARYDRKGGGKAILPFSFVKAGDAEGRWESKLQLPGDDLRPLYNLLDIKNNPEKRVLVVEGEKAADAAIKIFPNFAVTTWSSGTKSIVKSDWGRLKDRDVLIWPDNDEVGFKAAKQIAHILVKLGTNSEPMITHTTMDKWPFLPTGWDVADGQPGEKSVDDIIEEAEAFKEEILQPVTSETRGNVVKAMAKRFKMVNMGGHMIFVDITKPDMGLNSSLPYAIYRDKSNFLTAHPQKFFDPATGKKLKKVTAFLEDEELDVLSGTKMEVSTTEPVVIDKGNRRLNIWTGFAAVPKLGDGHLPLMEHLNRHVDADGREWFLDWLAHLVQKPDVKPGTAVILRGTQGSGKTVISEVIATMIGDRHAYTGAFHSSVGKDFNGQASSKIFMGLDEIEMSISNRKTIESAIKVATTDRYIHVNEKYGLARTEVSYHRYLFTTNAKLAIPVYVEDRRLTVLDVEKEDGFDFTPLWDMCRNAKALGALLYFLQTREITHDVRLPPTTAAREDMISHSDDLLVYIEDILHGSDIPRSWGRQTTQTVEYDWDQEHVRVSRRLVYDSYISWLNYTKRVPERRSKRAITQMLMSILTEVGPQRFTDPSDERSFMDRGFDVEPKIVSRKKFETFIGRPIKWGDAAEELRTHHQEEVPF